MSTTINTGWLNDNNGEKFAPKTLTSQVQTSDGILLEDKIQQDLNNAKAEILASVTIPIDSALSSSSTNPVQNKVINSELTRISNALNQKADSTHNHDSRYYTETEINNKLSSKANSSHTHTISEINSGNSTAGQFIVSDGNGGITWMTVNNGNEVAY